MKKLFTLLFVVLALYSCKDKNAYTISGTIDNTDENLKAYISRDEGRSFADSTLVVDGRFSFSGIQEGVEMPMVGILTGEKKMAAYPVPFFLEPGDIKIEIKDNKAVVSGTPLNDKYASIGTKAEALGDGAANLDYLKTMLMENADNPIGEFILPQMGPALKPVAVLEIIAAMPEKTRDKEEIKKAKQRAEEALANSHIGKPFIDIKGLSIDGKEVSLSDYAGKGKVVLLDFWASWCGPCIADMPLMKNIYEQYKDKGFEIVGVSLDGDATAWTTATEKHGITWPQFSNLKSWKDPVAEAYNVRSIPYTVLIDKDGTIIEEQLRGTRITEELSALLDK